MDGPELIRNVTLCGHLHHGKVRVCLIPAPGSGFFKYALPVVVLLQHVAKRTCVPKMKN